MNVKYTPKGVCSSLIEVELEGEMIKNVIFTDGCAGNTMGVSKLVEGQNAHDVIETLAGIPCGLKPTSCPDQLAKALEYALSEQKEPATN